MKQVVGQPYHNSRSEEIDKESIYSHIDAVSLT